MELHALADKTGYICKHCRTINGSSKFSIRVKNSDVHTYFVTIGNYRLINEKFEGFTILRQIIHHPKAAGPTYESLYEGPPIDISPFDIEALESYVKTILVFM